MLDTNIVSSLIREDDASMNVAPRLARVETIGLSAIVLAELEIGLQLIHATKRGKRLSANLADFLRLEKLMVVPFSAEDAVEAGRLYSRRKKGRALTFQDTAIAATAHLRGALLVTGDRDFEALPRGYLDIENWLEG